MVASARPIRLRNTWELIINNAAVFGVVAGVVAGLYLLRKLIPKESRLHKSNHQKARQLLAQLRKGSYAPETVFGILRRTNWFVFEEMLLLSLRKNGFKVARNSAYTGDGGIDGIFYDKKGNKFLIQAKRYKSAINPQHVTEFAEVVEKERATGGFFIHTGRTGIKSYHNLTPSIRVISGAKLLKLLGASKVSTRGDVKN